MKSLSKLCEISLMRNYQQIQNVANVPYRLIQDILLKVKFDQLCRLEKSNVLLIFEDDELWLNLLKQDFPTSTHESFVSKKDVIRQYYMDFVQENDPALLEADPELVETYLQPTLRKSRSNGQFRMPYRMLYFRYQEDVIRKQEKSAERLRLQMKQLQQERIKNQIVVVDPPFSAKGLARRSAKEHHSELFRKSMKEHDSRLRHFKNGGFDIAKRHATRVAFGGSAGGAPTGSPQPHAGSEPIPIRKIVDEPPREATSPADANPGLPPAIKKRRTEPPSIFLKKKPAVPIARTREPPAPPSQPVAGPRNATSGHKKKSALFDRPSQNPSTQDSPVAGNRSQHRSIYIFDKRHRTAKNNASER
ncbi:hypothetical protein HG536_0D00310 [Torulaspora globosa]|uniref:Elongin-A n=1 Tax=Torulaspora globosa TaxID=48254 RepID=A0A7G3ZG73_9SACH|nr:uncharacterized protein HG536_0D00310 [Torulaspora globosa]QLL32509.1 hypothetical protein HG536_0D00310 [Torulaspora globosa]